MIKNAIIFVLLLLTSNVNGQIIYKGNFKFSKTLSEKVCKEYGAFNENKMPILVWKISKELELDNCRNDGVYISKKMSMPHAPRHIFIVRNSHLFAIKSLGFFVPEEVTKEFCTILKDNKEKIEIEKTFLGALYHYLFNEFDLDYGTSLNKNYNFSDDQDELKYIQEHTDSDKVNSAYQRICSTDTISDGLLECLTSCDLTECELLSLLSLLTTSK